MTRLTVPLLLAVGAFVVGCSPDVPDQSIALNPHDKTKVQDYNYLCEQGYTEYCPTGPDTSATAPTDGNPAAPGKWLGPNTLQCFAPAPGADNDGDGMDDNCEYSLAFNFAPNMILDTDDPAPGREPYWVVRPSPNASNTAIVGYLISYYQDDGCTAGFPCGAIDGGHFGDSEAIFLTLTLDGTSHHWVVTNVWLSEHTGYASFAPSGGLSYPTIGSQQIGGVTTPAAPLEYPGQLGGQFNVYVANSKHANYSTRAACNAGGYYGSDECSNTVGTALYVGTDRNLGSYTTKFKDCVPSVGLLAGNGINECYWTGGTFGGWFPVDHNGNDPFYQAGLISDPYGYRLTHFGFMPCFTSPVYLAPDWMECAAGQYTH